MFELIVARREQKPRHRRGDRSINLSLSQSPDGSPFSHWFRRHPATPSFCWTCLIFRRPWGQSASDSGLSTCYSSSFCRTVSFPGEEEWQLLRYDLGRSICCVRGGFRGCVQEVQVSLFHSENVARLFRSSLHRVFCDFWCEREENRRSCVLDPRDQENTRTSTESFLQTAKSLNTAPRGACGAYTPPPSP